MPQIILLIDDEEIIRMTSGEILNELGYDVLCAANGDEGMAILKEKNNSISLVILDMSMPGKSGIEIYREIKEFMPSMKVLLTSGYKEEENVEQMLEKANDGFIQKPYTIDELNNRLASMI
jgi:DNA-binding response OmpR family regulator